MNFKSLSEDVFLINYVILYDNMLHCILWLIYIYIVCIW